MCQDESRVKFTAEQLAEMAAKAAEISTRFARSNWTLRRKTSARLEAAIPQRQVELEKLAKREDAQEMEISGDLLSTENLNERVGRAEEGSGRTDRSGSKLPGHGSMRSPRRTTGRRTVCQHELTGALTELSGELLELSLLQARARLDAITFETVDLTPEQGYCIASRHRRDWMNARAALVDSWRLITFNADDLQSDLDFVFSGDIGNVGNNPLRLPRQRTAGSASACSSTPRSRGWPSGTSTASR